MHKIIPKENFLRLKRDPKFIRLNLTSGRIGRVVYHSHISETDEAKDVKNLSGRTARSVLYPINITTRDGD